MIKKITHEQASDYVNSGDYYEPKGLIRKPMNDYIAQQEKLEKLLNQIKDIINRPYDISSMLEESKRYVEIENLIKELENE